MEETEDHTLSLFSNPEPSIADRVLYPSRENATNAVSFWPHRLSQGMARNQL